MDVRIPPTRPDVVAAETAPRPTATPPRVQFSKVLASGAGALVSTAEAAMSQLPGAPLMAVAVRGGSVGVPAGPMGTESLPITVGSPQSPPLALGPAGSAVAVTGLQPEGPGGSSAGIGAVPPGTSDGGLQSSLSQAQEMNLYYLQIQEQVSAQDRTFTALSNVIKTEHDTAKSAIGNIHS
jgi:hypothetical protein